MKTNGLFLAFLLLLTIGCQSHSVQVQTKSSNQTQNKSEDYHPVQPFDQKEILTIDFISPNEGWMTTMNDNNQVYISHTKDGGQHWKQQSDVKINGGRWIHFFNKQEGYLDGSENHLFFTKDGGKTWDQRPLPGNQHDTSLIQFPSKNSIWELGDIRGAAGSEAATLYHSQDGGKHWAKAAEASLDAKPNSLEFQCDKIGISFINDNSGWVTGSCNGPAFYVEFTQDGGKSWTMQRFPQQIQATEAGTWIDSPQFSDSRNGWLIINSPYTSGYLLHTGDSGLNWTFIKQFDHSLSQMVTTDILHAWLIQNNPPKQANNSLNMKRNILEITKDQGKHWNEVTLNEINNIKQLEMVNNQVGWILSGNRDEFSPMHSHLYKTKNGGFTWNLVH